MALQEANVVCGNTYKVSRNLMGDFEFRESGGNPLAFIIEQSDVAKYDALENVDLIRLYRQGQNAGRLRGREDVRAKVMAVFSSG